MPEPDNSFVSRFGVEGVDDYKQQVRDVIRSNAEYQRSIKNVGAQSEETSSILDGTIKNINAAGVAVESTSRLIRASSRSLEVASSQVSKLTKVVRENDLLNGITRGFLNKFGLDFDKTLKTIEAGADTVNIFADAGKRISSEFTQAGRDINYTTREVLTLKRRLGSSFSSLNRATILLSAISAAGAVAGGTLVEFADAKRPLNDITKEFEKLRTELKNNERALLSTRQNLNDENVKEYSNSISVLAETYRTYANNARLANESVGGDKTLGQLQRGYAILSRRLDSVSNKLIGSGFKIPDSSQFLDDVSKISSGIDEVNLRAGQLASGNRLRLEDQLKITGELNKALDESTDTFQKNIISSDTTKLRVELKGVGSGIKDVDTAIRLLNENLISGNISEYSNIFENIQSVLSQNIERLRQQNRALQDPGVISYIQNLERIRDRYNEINEVVLKLINSEADRSRENKKRGGDDSPPTSADTDTPTPPPRGGPQTPPSPVGGAPSAGVEQESTIKDESIDQLSASIQQALSKPDTTKEDERIKSSLDSLRGIASSIKSEVEKPDRIEKPVAAIPEELFPTEVLEASINKVFSELKKSGLEDRVSLLDVAKELSRIISEIDRDKVSLDESERIAELVGPALSNLISSIQIDSKPTGGVKPSIKVEERDESPVTEEIKKTNSILESFASSEGARTQFAEFFSGAAKSVSDSGIVDQILTDDVKNELERNLGNIFESVTGSLGISRKSIEEISVPAEDFARHLFSNIKEKVEEESQKEENTVEPAPRIDQERFNRGIERAYQQQSEEIKKTITESIGKIEIELDTEIDDDAIPSIADSLSDQDRDNLQKISESLKDRIESEGIDVPDIQVPEISVEEIDINVGTTKIVSDEIDIEQPVANARDSFREKIEEESIKAKIKIDTETEGDFSGEEFPSASLAAREEEIKEILKSFESLLDTGRRNTPANLFEPDAFNFRRSSTERRDPSKTREIAPTAKINEIDFSKEFTEPITNLISGLDNSQYEKLIDDLIRNTITRLISQETTSTDVDIIPKLLESLRDKVRNNFDSEIEKRGAEITEGAVREFISSIFQQRLESDPRRPILGSGTEEGSPRLSSIRKVFDNLATEQSKIGDVISGIRDKGLLSEDLSFEGARELIIGFNTFDVEARLESLDSYIDRIQQIVDLGKQLQSIPEIRQSLGDDFIDIDYTQFEDQIGFIRQYAEQLERISELREQGIRGGVGTTRELRESEKTSPDPFPSLNDLGGVGDLQGLPTINLVEEFDEEQKADFATNVRQAFQSIADDSRELLQNYLTPAFQNISRTESLIRKTSEAFPISEGLQDIDNIIRQTLTERRFPGGESIPLSPDFLGSIREKLEQNLEDNFAGREVTQDILAGAINEIYTNRIEENQRNVERATLGLTARTDTVQQASQNLVELQSIIGETVGRLDTQIRKRIEGTLQVVDNISNIITESSDDDLRDDLSQGIKGASIIGKPAERLIERYSLIAEQFSNLQSNPQIRQGIDAGAINRIDLEDPKRVAALAEQYNNLVTEIRNVIKAFQTFDVDIDAPKAREILSELSQDFQNVAGEYVSAVDDISNVTISKGKNLNTETSEFFGNVVKFIEKLSPAKSYDELRRRQEIDIQDLEEINRNQEKLLELYREANEFIQKSDEQSLERRFGQSRTTLGIQENIELAEQAISKIRSA